MSAKRLCRMGAGAIEPETPRLPDDVLDLTSNPPSSSDDDSSSSESSDDEIADDMVSLIRIGKKVFMINFSTKGGPKIIDGSCERVISRRLVRHHKIIEERFHIQKRDTEGIKFWGRNGVRGEEELVLAFFDHLCDV